MTGLSNLILRETIEHVPEFRVAGLTGRFEPSTYVQVGDLWKQAMSKIIASGHLGSGETIGVFRDRDLTTHSFEHLAGVRIAMDVTPDGLDVWTVPDQRYLVFKQTLASDELHPQVAAAQNEIWNVRLPRSGRTWSRTPDYQIYPANFRVGPEGWIAYYIPVD